MMYIIYNHDGSIKTLVVDESIQQNNNGVNQIFVSIEGYETADYTCVANFELPDGTLNSLVGVADVGVEVGELAYDGFVITLTNAQTLYPGKLKMSIKLVDLQDRQLCTYQTELQVNPSSSVPSETLITNAQYNSLIQSLQSYVLYADLVNYADKEWVKDNFQPSVYPIIDLSSLGTLNDVSVKDLCDYITNNNLSFDKSYIIKTAATYPGGPLVETAVFINFALIYPEHYWVAFKTPDIDHLNISSVSALSIIANSFDGTLEQFGDITLLTAFRPRTIKKLYRHLLGITGDGGYAVGFELINDDSSSMAITGSFDSTTKTLTFSNINKKYQNLKFIGARGSNDQYLYATINYLGTTDQYGTLKIRTYRIQSDGTLSLITTYNDFTDTVEEL